MPLWERLMFPRLRANTILIFPTVNARLYSKMARTYGDSIEALNSLQSNFANVEMIRKSRPGVNELSIPEMVEWCRKIGYQPRDFNRLNLIHIAGTKGKGSTCAFISSILSQYLPKASGSADVKQPGHKIGLYTSPHLRFVRERIQINNTPLSEEQFAKYFFETWDRLEESARTNGTDPSESGTKPPYFRFLTLMAFHTYMSEGVDAAIIECGIGGEYDPTNVMDRPLATGITSLGIDHVSLLGPTVEQIAWHKAGIMKPDTLAYTAPQLESAMEVLQERAKEREATLQVATGHPELQPGNPGAVKLGLSGDVQYKNAELAVSVCNGFLRKLGFADVPEDVAASPLPSKFKRGLETVQLGGRCEKRVEDNVAWHIDGGHTLDSIEATGKWYSSQPYTLQNGTNPRPRVLIFNQQTRDSASLARGLHQALTDAGDCSFTHAIFCTNVTFRETGYRPDLMSINTNSTEVEKLSVQKDLAKVWKEVSPSTEVEALATIEEAVEFVRNLADPKSKGVSETDQAAVSVLVTGSLHLVGGLLEVIETIPRKKT